MCYCPERDLVLGTKAYVCQVCLLYSQTDKKFSEIYEESKKAAEKKIKDRKVELEAMELEKLEDSEEVELTTDEFEEEEEKMPLKFEKRKIGKGEIEDSEEFVDVECPFCGEIFDDLVMHIQTCEFAPDDASIKDIMPDKKRKRKRKSRADTTTSAKSSKEPQEKKPCPYCGKEFVRLGRHLNSCKKKPKDAEEAKEE